MGPAFARLAEPVQVLHLRMGRNKYHGQVSVVRGHSLLSRLFAHATHLPPAGEGPLRVVINSEAGSER